MATKFTLGKKERLKSRKTIDQLFKEGQRLTVTPLRVFYRSEIIAPPSGVTLQCGVGVSSKNFKRAVDRNRVKRLVREAYRLQKCELQEKLAAKKISCSLFLVYTARELPDQLLIMEKLGIVLKKLAKIFDEKDPSAF